LHWFSNIFQSFSQVFQTLILSISFVFFCMLQLLHLDVLKATDGADNGAPEPTADALPREPDALCAHLLPLR
jgi:hypothetical protein